MTDAVQFTLVFAAIGITIVFLALAIISAMVSMMRRADSSWETREQKQQEEAGEKDPTIDSTTLVLIAAAAATMIHGRFRIRRVRRLMSSDAPKSPWSMQGRATLMGSHVVPKKR
jgi:Na+-transporting methylmalonyl-CoA/oxaloacetate decarboxylase gamma subunit